MPAIKPTQSTPPAVDHIQAALEASNGALIGLEWIVAQLADEADDRASVRSQTRQAIESLRDAITELRLARGEGCIAMTLGFVLRAD